MDKYKLLIQEALEQYGILIRVHDPITKSIYGVQHTVKGLNAEIIFLNKLNIKKEI